MKKKVVDGGRGSKHPLAKLKAAQVRAIRKALEKGKKNRSEIAREYDVSPMVIKRIGLGLSYKDVV
jgi:DNA invertase Pin-like site-specific DNA recombinase